MGFPNRQSPPTGPTLVGPTLKLVRFDDHDAPDDAPDHGGPLARSMTLSEFAEAWYIPIVLEAERESSESTLVELRRSLWYWERTTGAPSLAEIEAQGDILVAKFQTGLRNWQWAGRGRFSQTRPLTPATIAKHLRQVRAVLYRIGPQTDPARTAKRLVDQVPYIRVRKPKGKPKGRMELAEVEALFQSVDLMTNPGRWSASPSGRRKPRRDDSRRGITERWRAFVLVSFYTGMRIGALLLLERSMLTRTREGQHHDSPHRCGRCRSASNH